MMTSPTATLRIISQPANGSLDLNNNFLTYFLNAGFTGSKTLTFIVCDGSKNSNRASGTA
jgi:hypothetical protein